MKIDFDTFTDRHNTDSAKWRRYGPEVLPLWVADMDFISPKEVLEAIRDRVEHGIFGYGIELPELRQVIVDRMFRKYKWVIKPEDVLFIPGVVRGFNLACQTIGRNGESVIVQTPVYPPILKAPANAGMCRKDVGFERSSSGKFILNKEKFEDAIDGKTKLFILCNPHNPIGHVFTRQELEFMAEICLARNVAICSDEIHAELIFSGFEHLPIAALNPEIAQKTITLSAPSKTFNLAGLDFSFAIIQNEELRESFCASMKGLVGSVNVLGQVAALAAYQHGDIWLNEVLIYLENNRNFLLEFIKHEIPGILVTEPEATYLAWLNCKNLELKPNPYQFFLDHAKVALWNGEDFGPGGDGHVRINFGCPLSTLEEALMKMKSAING